MENNYDSFIGNLKPTVFLPDKRLVAYIQNYIYYEAVSVIKSETEVTVIPNGFVELYLHFGNSHIINGSDQKQILNSYLVGMYEATNPQKVIAVQAEELTKGLVIKFTYKGLQKLLNISLPDLSNKIISIEDLWGFKGRKLYERLMSTDNIDERITILNLFFLNQVSEDRAYMSLDMDGLLKLFNEKVQLITVENLAFNFNVSYRTLHRKFKEEIGICPKEYLKIIRFDRICNHISRCKNLSLSEILLYGGYFDQAHFIHEFKEIMKVCPSELLKQSHGNFYITRGLRVE